MDGEAKLPISNGNVSRMLRVTTLIDGVATPVLMPVVALADADGRPLPPLSDATEQAMLLELRAIRLGIQNLINAGQDNQDDLLELATSPLDIIED